MRGNHENIRGTEDPNEKETRPKMTQIAEVTGNKFPQRGTRIKDPASSFDATGVKLVGKNFGKPGTRFYGFFGAFIGKAKRVATVRQMVDSYWAMQDAFGKARDDESAVVRDLANYISAWTNPTKGGLHLNVVRVNTDVSKTDLTAKYKLVSVRADSSYAPRAAELGWPVS
jgi:hypothetical protein